MARLVLEEMLIECDGRTSNVEKYVIVTLGKEGVYVVSGRKNGGIDDGQFNVNSFDLAPDDVSESMVNCTGAGDTLVGGTLHALSTGHDMQQSLKIGMNAAKLSVESDVPVSPLLQYKTVYY